MSENNCAQIFRPTIFPQSLAILFNRCNIIVPIIKRVTYMCWLEDEPKGIKPVGRPKLTEEEKRHDIHPSVSFDTKVYLYSRVDSRNHEIKAGVYIDMLVKADKVKLNYHSEVDL